MTTQNSDGNADFPWVIDINVFMTPKSETNWANNAVFTNMVNNAYHNSTGAQNAEIAWDVLLGAGTWTVELVHYTDTNQGIFSVQIDSVEEGTVDAYAGSATSNVQSTVTGITSDSGIHELKLKMATKNASSSSYVGGLNHIQLRRTA